jgi:hypothetical protein
VQLNSSFWFARTTGTVATIDYRWEDIRKKIGELRGTLMPSIDRSLRRRLSRNPNIATKTQTLQPGDSTSEDTVFKPGLEIVRFYTKLNFTDSAIRFYVK